MSNPTTTGEWTVEQRITDYLASGGMFNPELADHDAVSRLLFDCRAALESAKQDFAKQIAAERKQVRILTLSLGQVHDKLAAERERSQALLDSLRNKQDELDASLKQLAAEREKLEQLRESHACLFTEN